MGGCVSAPRTGPSGPKKLRRLQLVGGGAFSVIQELGNGAWSDVYLVERIKDGRHYALKRTLINELSEAEKWIAVNEVRLLASLEHPNVVSYKQGFVEGGCLYVIMEVVPNGDLSTVIERHRRSEAHIAEKKVWGFLLQIALGLQHLHVSNIVHRDIKPQNILINKEGVLKIADLGVAGLLHMGSSKLQIGTPQYMAPEMHAGRSYTAAADVWSLGCLLYELCALQPLFQDREEEVVARKVLATTLPPALPSKYSPELQLLFNRMMQHDPELRPTVSEVLLSPQLESRLNLLPAGLERSLSQLSLSLGCLEGLPVLPAIDIPEDLHELNHRLPPPRYSSDNLGQGGLELAERSSVPAIVPPRPPPEAARDAGQLPARPAAAADDGPVVSAPAAAPAAAPARADAAAGIPLKARPALPKIPAAAALIGADAGPSQQQRQQQQQRRALPPHCSLPRIASLTTVLENELCSTASGSVATPVGGPGTGGSGGVIDACVVEARDDEQAGTVHAAARTQGAAVPLAWVGRTSPGATASPFAEQRARFVSGGI